MMKSPEISQQQLIFLLSSIGLITLPHSLQVPMLLFGFFAFLWSWRFIGIWRKTLLPNAVMTFLLMLTGIGLLILQYHGVVFGRDAGTGLFIVALGLKLLEIKTPRDIYLITYLAFIVAATQFLYLQNVFMAVYILAVCGLLLCTLISLNNQNSKTLAS
jgi:protein-glutamine gamma-glutamyltransferase